ncbi:hypothetical protein TNCV_3908111 [Trichonephila clavipes]|nr:hypothetical protein TNCV_3908111 [Trichonephila clavipes]
MFRNVDVSSLALKCKPVIYLKLWNIVSGCQSPKQKEKTKAKLDTTNGADLYISKGQPQREKHDKESMRQKSWGTSGLHEWCTSGVFQLWNAKPILLSVPRDRTLSKEFDSQEKARRGQIDLQFHCVSRSSPGEGPRLLSDIRISVSAEYCHGFRAAERSIFESIPCHPKSEGFRDQVLSVSTETEPGAERVCL